MDLTFFVLNENTPFAITLAIMLGIVIIELVTTTLGFGLSHILDNFLHVDFNLDHDVSFDGHSGIEGAHHDFHSDHLPLFTKFIGWIRFKHVPILVVFVTFLTLFSIVGYTEQLIAFNLNMLLPWYIAIWPALFISIPLVRTISYLLGTYVIKDETTAVSSSSFLNKTAVITIGTARVGYPAQAKLTDKYGQAHYIMIEPKDKNDSFPMGTKLEIIDRDKKANHLFYGKRLDS